MNNQIYYAIYSRKSKFTGKGESIENQIELCKKQLLYKYGEDIKKQILIYQDEGFTGYNTHRPEFQKLLLDIREKKIKVLIVYRLDRVSRNVSDFCNLKDELAKYNVDFISVTENFDTSTPMGTAMLMISSVFAQLERDTIADRIRDNMYELAKTGRWLGGNTPLGYKSKKIEKIDLNGKKRYLYTLTIIDDEIKTINLIWDKMLELKGLSKLESYLLQKGIKTRNNNNFSRFSLVNILKNPVYVIADQNIKNFFKKMGVSIYASKKDFDGKHGLIAYNKRLEKVGKTQTMKDISEWIIAVGKHKGIISSDKFIKTWQLIENNKDKRLRLPPQNTSILSGIIKCPYCGSYMRPKMRNSYNQKHIRNFVYLCELKDKSRKKLCTCPNLNGLETDQIILNKIKELKLPINVFLNKLKELISNQDKRTNIKKNELQSLKTSFTNNKIKITKLVEKLAEADKEIVTEITKQIKEFKKQNKYIENQIKKIETNDKIEIKDNQITKIALKIVNNYMHTFDELDINSKRTLLKLIINSVEINKENIYINLVGSQKCPRSYSSRSYS